MKTKVIGTLLAITALFGASFAAEIAWFVVKVDPSTLKVGQPADVSIKAIDENGDVVTDYKWDVAISLEDQDGNEIDDDSTATLPGDGTYSFTDEDQWEKKFTKWFIVNKAGDYKLVVADFDDDSKKWSVDVKVVNASEADKWKVTLTTPQDGEVSTSSTITVAGSAQKYMNSKIEIIVDGKKAEEGQVDNSGNFQVDVSNLSNGDHTIKVNVLDIDGNVVSSSKEISVKVNADQQLLKNVEILPKDSVDQGTKVTVNAEVAPSVSSVVMTVENYGDYPMDRVSGNKFTAQFVANTPWKFNLSFNVKWDFGEKKYENKKVLTVLEKIAIKSVKFVRDNSKKTIDLSWKFTGNVPAFKVEYSTEKSKIDNDLSDSVKENKDTLKNIDETKTYFVKIIPTDSEGNKIWDESKLIVIEPDMKKSATCTIDNIKVNVVVEWKKHYLVWDNVEDALKYNIYKWTWENNLIKIASVTGTTYEFPYDYNAKKNEYAYFSVKAVCDDGTEKQIDKVKKVKVGPMEWLVYALIIAMMIYGIRLSIKNI